MIASIAADMHQVGIYLGCVVFGSFILMAIRMLWRSGTAIKNLESHVLPHFLPPTHDEIRNGHTDNSLPARIERQELNLARHLADEEIAAKELHDQLDEIRNSLSRMTAK
jgi:hypothetical protein